MITILRKHRFESRGDVWDREGKILLGNIYSEHTRGGSCGSVGENKLRKKERNVELWWWQPPTFELNEIEELEWRGFQSLHFTQEPARATKIVWGSTQVAFDNKTKQQNIASRMPPLNRIVGESISVMTRIEELSMAWRERVWGQDRYSPVERGERGGGENGCGEERGGGAMEKYWTIIRAQ